MSVKPIPDNYHRVTPYLIVEDVDRLIEFLKEVFEAKVSNRMTGPDGKPMHAEVRIGEAAIMMGAASEEFGALQSMNYIYVEDTDATYQRALTAGAASLMKPEDQFYGDRNAGVKGPQGNYWWIATHVEDVSPEEMNRRSEKRA